MLQLDKLMGHRKLEGPLVPFIPLIAAGVGAAGTVYVAKKAQDAADDKAQTDSMMRKEQMALGETRDAAARDREKAQAQTREIANADAEDAQISTMESIVEKDKLRLEQEKLLAAKDAENEYAAKFKPGQGGDGTDTVNDFLVPKVADDTGLVASDNTSSGGLIAPLKFNV